MDDEPREGGLIDIWFIIKYISLPIVIIASLINLYRVLNACPNCCVTPPIEWAGVILSILVIFVSIYFMMK